MHGSLLWSKLENIGHFEKITRRHALLGLGCAAMSGGCGGWPGRRGPVRYPTRAPGTIDAHRGRLHEFRLPDWGTLRYVDEGRGPPVMLVHGVPTSSWLYRHVTHELIARGHRVIAPDLIGFGASDKPRNPELLTAGRQGDRLLQLASHLGIQKWTHVCHDAGGPWTWEMMEKSPNRVERLIVLNTIAYTEGWKPPLEMRVDGILSRNLRRALMSEVMGPTWTKLILKAGTTRRDLTRDPELVAGYWRSMPEGTANAVVSFMERLDEIEAALPRYQHTLRHFMGPACIVWGQDDTILRHREQVPMLQHALAIADPYVTVLPGVGHFLQEEQPHQLARSIADFARDTA